MNASMIFGFIFVFVVTNKCYCQNLSAIYRPLGANSSSAYAMWDSLRQASAAPTAEGDRPVLPGVTGRNLELLQDAVARKYPRVTKGSSLPIARKILANTSQRSVPKLRGYMAEAMFLDRNPEWKYVKNPNAPQHDVWAKPPDGRRGQKTGQVKFIMNGDKLSYANHMIKDNKSGNFFVPDDHVDQLKAYFKAKAEKLSAEGDKKGAGYYYREMNRVKGIGATSTQIDHATRQAIAEARLVRVAPYVFVGVAATLLIAPTMWDYYQGDIDSNEAVYRLITGGSGVASGIVADQALKKWKGGLLRGTIRGNVITTFIVLVVDTSWQVYEYGGFHTAIQSPDFISNFVGSLSAASCWLAGAGVGAIGGAKAGGAIGAFFGPEGVPIGASIGGSVGGLVVGSAAAAAGYFGGSKGARWVMETYCPEKLYDQERGFIKNLRDGIDESIRNMQTI